MKTENAEELIKKLMTYYNVFSMHELAKKIGISQPAITKWKKNNSINAIKKKCRELGIYNDIFGDISNNNEYPKTLMDIAAKHFNVKNGKEVIELLESNNANLLQKQNEWMLDSFDDDVKEALRTAATLIKNDEKNQSFKNHIKKWIIDNL
ncbi:hypothetical protein [Halarcobacter bivalviorum]|uniref:hypothetical protein n=1 Tax=Halarcobacter bivalviorum TaxID=663364 RepID=UPI00100BB7A4|nr:hypothetical protein [Halarcobacter bivalviorum]RXK06982.1 hypothetical protein CRU97_02420 [Halarcobacter bivalviorum]